MKWRSLLLALLSLWPLGCRKSEPQEAYSGNSGPAAAAPDAWDVRKGGRLVLKLKNKPGPLLSSALLPAGRKPTAHPFLSAEALDPMEEDNLRRLLDKSRSFDEFFAHLKKSGYTLTPAGS